MVREVPAWAPLIVISEIEPSTVAERAAEIVRKTRETDIRLRLDLDGAGRAQVATGVGFLDHMLELYRPARADGPVGRVHGDLHVDAHHTTEDVGICLGQALDRRWAIGRGSAAMGTPSCRWTRRW